MSDAWEDSDVGLIDDLILANQKPSRYVLYIWPHHDGIVKSGSVLYQ